MLARAYRLCAASDFQRVRAAGRSWGHPLLTLHVAPGTNDAVRVGFVVSKRTAKAAVARNRVKRRMRGIVRELLPRVRPGLDLVISARPGATGATYAVLHAGVGAMLQRAGALSGEIE